MSINKFTSKRFTCLMACLSGLTAIGIDAVLPIFPQMIEYYNIPEAEHNRIQQVVFMYVLGFSLFQVVYGVLADTFGRKPVLYLGISIYVAMSLLIMVTEQFNYVLLARFLQGAGLAAPRVLTMTIVRDVSSGSQMSKMLSIITMVFLSIPMVAPIIGQIVVMFAPWQAVFGLLAFFAIILMAWLRIDLPETLSPQHRRPLSFKKITIAVKEFLANKETLLLLVIKSSVFASLMMYIGQSEQILQRDIYNLGKLFPLAFSFVIISMIGAAVFNSRMVIGNGPEKIIAMGLKIMIISDVSFLVFTLIFGGVIPLWLFLSVLLIHFFAFGLMTPNLTTLVLAPYQHIAGTSAALIGMISSILGVMVASLFSYFYNGTLYSISIGFSLCLLTAYIAHKKLFCR